MDDTLDAGTTDSSSATQDTATSSQGATDPAQAGDTGKLTPFHQHPDWQRMVQKNRAYEQRASQAEQRAQQYEARLAQLERANQSQGGLTSEQQKQYAEAGDALLNIIRVHPQLKGLLDLMQHLPTLAQGYQGVQSLTQAHQQSLVTQGRTQLESLAKASGYNLDKATFKHFENLVAATVRDIENGQARFKAGDMSVLTEALEEIKPFLKSMGIEQQATTAQTKNKLRNLPPAPTRGGSPGQPAPAKLEDPSKAREFESSMFKRAAQMAAELTKG